MSSLRHFHLYWISILIDKTRWALCHHSTSSCLTAAGHMTAVNCVRGFAIITPPLAVDLKYPIIGAFTARIVVCSFCVITAFPFGQTQPWKKCIFSWKTTWDDLYFIAQSVLFSPTLLTTYFKSTKMYLLVKYFNTFMLKRP